MVLDSPLTLKVNYSILGTDNFPQVFGRLRNHQVKALHDSNVTFKKIVTYAHELNLLNSKRAVDRVRNFVETKANYVESR